MKSRNGTRHTPITRQEAPPPAKGRGLTVQDLRATLAPSRPISNHGAKRGGAAGAPAALATGL